MWNYGTDSTTMPFMWNYGTDSTTMPFMWIGIALAIVVMLIFSALLIWLIVTIIRRNNAQSTSPSSSRAVDLLKERYARGEIDSEEFRERLAELNENKHI